MLTSPGGMVDGTIIQNRDPFRVPSTRRNPIIADVFSRLGYMERKGSGFEKIIVSYENQANYTDGKKPTLFSDISQFTVIMPNLNYGVLKYGLNGAVDVGQDVGQGGYRNHILNIIRNNNKISKATIAKMLDVSEKTIEREMKKIDNIHFVGRGYSGHWEIDE